MLSSLLFGSKDPVEPGQLLLNDLLIEPAVRQDVVVRGEPVDLLQFGGGLDGLIESIDLIVVENLVLICSCNMHWVSDFMVELLILIAYLLHNVDCHCVVRSLELQLIHYVSYEEREVLEGLGREGARLRVIL
jgi:hypothetical protein